MAMPRVALMNEPPVPPELVSRSVPPSSVTTPLVPSAPVAGMLTTPPVMVTGPVKALLVRLSFVVKKKPGGAMSEWLFGHDVEGARLGVFAPVGHAIFRPDTRKHILCIAGGSGIAGMMSILARACGGDHCAHWDDHVFFGVRTVRAAV